MEDQKLVFARCCFSAPVASYRIRSWCNRWLSCAPLGTAYFSEVESEASLFYLSPYVDGRYRLQLLAKSSKAWFLCCRDGVVVCTPESTMETLLFSLELEEYGNVRLRGGPDNDYLSSDRRGRVRAGVKKARKWESFTLFEQVVESVPKHPPWIVQAPVRVTLQSQSGKYLCAAKPVISTCAEAPCCCEEFILDLTFSSLPLSCESTSCLSKAHAKPRGLFQTLSMFGYRDFPANDFHRDQSSQCTMRTADGLCLLSAELDGSVFTTSIFRASGRETFFIDLHPDESSCKISFRHAEGRLLTESGLLRNGALRKSPEYFNIQLASGSRVLLKSVHGGFLGTDREGKRCARCQSKRNSEVFGAWQLRSHGDSYYTLVSLSTPERAGDQYMYADATGHIYQSSDPAVHFPSVTSLFEIKPVTERCISSELTACKGSNRIAGFTIRTVRRIKGKQRYLTVQPNGDVTALNVRPSRWEIFQIVDLDAAAAAAAPEEFSCSPASYNRQPASIFPRAMATAARTTNRKIAARSMNNACEVAALALHEGQAVPKRSAAPLQELCIGQICCHAAVELQDRDHSEALQRSPAPESEYSELVSALCALTGRYELLPIGVPAELTYDPSFNVPDDLLARIWATCRSKQSPRNSCKWVPSAFIPQSLQPQGPYARNNANRRVHRGVSEGWHCGTCDQGNVLPMDAAVNPAHHRYLEVQSRAYSRAIQSTGILWNLISLAGVSIMSTALFCQIKAAAGRRSSSSSRFSIAC